MSCVAAAAMPRRTACGWSLPSRRSKSSPYTRGASAGRKNLAELDDVASRTAVDRHKLPVDHGADHDDRDGLRPYPHEILDIESALDADRLVGADDLLDIGGLAERQQQPFIANVLAVGIL